MIGRGDRGVAIHISGLSDLTMVAFVRQQMNGCEGWRDAVRFDKGGRLLNGSLYLSAWGDLADQYKLCAAIKYSPLFDSDWVVTTAVLDVVNQQPSPPPHPHAPPRPRPPPSLPSEAHHIQVEADSSNGTLLVLLVIVSALLAIVLNAACCLYYNVQKRRKRDELLLEYRKQKKSGYEVFLSYRVGSDADMAERFYDKLTAR